MRLASFSALPSPLAITFTGSNGRSYRVGKDDRRFSDIREKMLLVQRNLKRDQAAAQRDWDEMTALMSDKPAVEDKVVQEVPPVADAAEDRAFDLVWIGAARPPLHPNPMTGRQTFSTFEKAVAFFESQSADATFVSLMERITTTQDRSDEVRALLAPQPNEVVEQDAAEATVQWIDWTSNKWIDLEESAGLSKVEALDYIACRKHTKSYRLKGDNSRLQAVIDVRLTGGEHIYTGVFNPVNVVVNGRIRKTFSEGTNMCAHREAIAYCVETFGFEDSDIRYLRANANFLMPIDDITLREHNNRVTVFVHNLGDKSFSEYRTAAEYLRNQYGFSDGDLMAIYHDYRADYDGADEEEIN